MKLNRKLIDIATEYADEDNPKEMRFLLSSCGSSKIKEVEDYADGLANELDVKVEEVKAKLQDTEIAIDYTVYPRPLELAKFLLDRGFNVSSVYLDGISPEDEEAYNYLVENFGDLTLRATIHPEGRVVDRDNANVLAIGQKAAWFNNTHHFVNIIEGDGCMGFEGLMTILDMMVEAYNEEKDLDDIVPRKAVGLCSNCGIV